MASHFFAKKSYFENFQLFFHEFLSNWLEMGPKIALLDLQNSKIFYVAQPWRATLIYFNI